MRAGEREVEEVREGGREERCLPTWFLFDDTCEDLGIQGAVGRFRVLPLLGLMNRDAAAKTKSELIVSDVSTHTGEDNPIH